MHKNFEIFAKGFLSLFLDEVAQFDTYSLCFSGVNSIYWNAAYKLDMMDSEVSESLVDIELLFFPKKLVPTLWITSDDHPDGLEYIVADKGYVQKAIDDWMLIISPASVEPPKDSFHIEQVQSEGQLDQFIYVFTEVFTDNDGKYGEMFKKKALDERYKDRSKLYVGYDGDNPVSMSGFVLSDNTAILHSVGTLINHRKKGYGNAMARHAIVEANASGGVAQIMLQVDEKNAAAVHLFQTIGFTDLMQVKIYAKA